MGRLGPVNAILDAGNPLRQGVQVAAHLRQHGKQGHARRPLSSPVAYKPASVVVFAVLRLASPYSHFRYEREHNEPHYEGEGTYDDNHDLLWFTIPDWRSGVKLSAI